MGFKLKRLVKSAKKTIKSAGRTAAKVVKYAAPVVGTVLLGPLGGAAGTALAAAASQVGPNKNRMAALKRAAIYGGGVTAAGAVLGLASGAGIGASGISSIGRIFGGGMAPTPQVDPANNELLNLERSLDSQMNWGAAAGTQGDPNAMSQTLDNALWGGIGGFLGNQSGPSGVEGTGQRTGGTFGREGGGNAGGANNPDAPGGDGGGFPLLPVLAIGGIALLAMKGKV